MLSGKHIFIGVSGGIAAYKTCEIVRQLRKINADVKIVMTEAATRFVGPITFETLSKNPVGIDMFSPASDSTAIHHIEIAEWADIGLVCPATLNTLSKIAYGLTDNLLTTIVSAMRRSVFLAPAMDLGMWKNPITQDTINRLKTFNYSIIQPEEGELASGLTGPGRLADPETVVNVIKTHLLSNKTKIAGKQKNGLKDKHIVITAGGTVEPIDPVRYISNRSSGKMGYALAEQALIQGAKVTLISAPTHLSPPEKATIIPVKTAEEMFEETTKAFKNADVAILASAVSDYRPTHYQPEKVKRSKEKLILELSPTKDIAAHLGKIKDKRIVIGFALETNNELENAKQKLKTKQLDLIAVNNPGVDGAGFEVDTNVITTIDNEDNVKEYPVLPKPVVAKILLDDISRLLSTKYINDK